MILGPKRSTLPNMSQSPVLDSYDISGIAEFVGATDEAVRNVFDPSDELIKNYFLYEQGKADPVIKGRLKSALSFWRNDVKAPHSVLSIIESGYKISFLTWT